MQLNKFLDVKPEVAEAIAAGKPVVALESTIISHGMPYPKNVQTALEVERIMEDCFLRFFERAVDEMGLYQNYNRKDQELILRYHSRAVMGLLRSWTPEDAADLDHMVHMLHLLLTGDIAVS